jgi:alpha-N-acetylglucosaminidase
MPIKAMKKIKYLICCFLVTIHFIASAQLDKPAAKAFIKRMVPAVADKFVVEEIPAENGMDVFELQSRNGKIVLGGNKALSIASALGYYLKYYCRDDFGWNGENLSLPARLPMVNGKIHRATPYKYRYYLNYCTFNYSMSWWGWDRWQQEIDWMALHGINMPLALTGEEAIWQQVYKNMGFTDNDLNSFFSGPAYFSWLWMGNLDGWGGPLPQHWMDSHKELQQKILARERSFGMTPVLPAFSGHVPPSFKDKFPQAKLKKTNWGGGFDDVYLLDPTDPMFTEIGKKYIEAQTKVYGTDHLYSSDTFNENVPPTDDSTFLSGVSKKIYQSMTAADPKAVWVMQGWLFYNDSQFWKPKQTKAMLNAVPDDGMIVLDLYSDEQPLWIHNSSYYGKPWIWNMLQNFGGNTNLYGRMETVATEPNKALHESKSMVGIGLTPEAIEQNPAVFELMMDNVWRDSRIDVATVPADGNKPDKPWIVDYAERRYGKSSAKINEAWDLMLKSVYSSASSGSPWRKSIIVGRPDLDMKKDGPDTTPNYDPQLLVKAWALFIQSAPELQVSDGFRFDLVDVTRQVLGNYANTIEPKIMMAYKQNDTAAFKQYTAAFIQLMDDMDELLGTRRHFLLGAWIADARANGITPKERNLYEFNARDLVTLWGNRDSPLHEYSSRQWAGLIKGFYEPRWKMFFAGLNQSMVNKTPFDNAAFENKVKDWEWAWVNKRDKYATTEKGNPVEVAERLFKKYDKNVQKVYK